MRVDLLKASSILVLLATLAVAACQRGPRVEIVSPDGTVRATVRVELAETQQSREVGLMYRKSLDPDAGMIFVFPAPRQQQFWMKNTEIPLDMIFANSSAQVIGLVEDARPFSEELLGAQGDSQYVVEVNGGFCTKFRVAVGDHLQFVGFVPHGQ